MAIMKLLARLSLIISVTLFARLAFADTLITTGGSKFEGKVSYNDTTKTYYLETATGGKMNFPAAMVSEVKKDAPIPPLVVATPAPSVKAEASVASPLPISDRGFPTAAPEPTISKEVHPSPDFPLQKLAQEANKHIAEIQADSSLTSAQKSIRTQKEVKNCKDFIEGKEWPFDSTLIDIKSNDNPHMDSKERDQKKGTWRVILDLHVTGIDPIGADLPLPDQVVETTKKGTPIKVLVKFTVEGESTLRLAINGIALATEGKALATPVKPMGVPVAFFGVRQAAAQKIVYIVDRSGSMTDSLDYVKNELKESIAKIDEETKFHVMFFSSGPVLELAGKGLLAASDRNKEMASKFIDGVVAQGETDPAPALKKAFDMSPDVIYLLTDGEFDKQVAPLIKKLNAQGKVVVHTIAFLYGDPGGILHRIAAENGGQFKFISQTDLTKLSGN
jgi:hypothetical protein